MNKWASWPGAIQPGSTVDQPIHMMVDMYPSLSEGKSSLRDEVVYDIEPFRAAVRKGDWKLVWQATLQSQVELFNLAEGPTEKTGIAGKNPQKVAELQRRIEALAREAVRR